LSSSVITDTGHETCQAEKLQTLCMKIVKQNSCRTYAWICQAEKLQTLCMKIVKHC